MDNMRGRSPRGSTDRGVRRRKVLKFKQLLYDVPLRTRNPAVGGWGVERGELVTTALPGEE